MSDDDWDKDDFEPPAVGGAADEELEDWEKDDFEPPAAAGAGGPDPSAWEGEDEEDEEAPAEGGKYEAMTKEQLIRLLKKKDKETLTTVKPSKAKKAKRKLIKEQEEAEKERRRKEQEAADAETQMSEAEKYAIKLARRMQEEEADLEIAKETFGMDADEADAEGVNQIVLIEAMQPDSPEEFVTFREAIVAKAAKHESSPFFAEFVLDLCRDISLGLSVDDLRKVSSAISVLYNEKQKAAKGPKKKKGKNKASLGAGKATTSKVIDSYDDYSAEFDDFM